MKHSALFLFHLGLTALPGFADAKSVRSILYGPLKFTDGAVVVPELDAIDLLVIE